MYVFIDSIYTFIYSLYTFICSWSSSSSPSPSSSSPSSSSSYMIYDWVWRCIAYLKTLWNTSTSYTSSRHSCAGSLWRAVLHATKSFLGSPNLPVWGSPWVTPWRSMEAQHSVGTPASQQLGPRGQRRQKTEDQTNGKHQAQSSTSGTHTWARSMPPPKDLVPMGSIKKRKLKKTPRSPRQKTNLWWSSRSTVCETVR